MARQKKQWQKEIMKRQKVLEKAAVTLKKEFIGIDKVIDEVVDALSSWYLFPDLQEKPVVINLWGLTGVGKSSLVTRLSQLIGFEEKFFHFDLGENEERHYSIKGKLEEIYEHVNGFPALLALDEFQHARTLDETGKELDKNSSRIIWQLLDSGKFQISRYHYRLEEVHDLILKLRFLLKNGVRVSKGKVTSKKTFYLEHMDMRHDFQRQSDKSSNQKPKELFFVPTSYYEGIFGLMKEKFASSLEVQESLLELNGYETLKFLIDVFNHGNSPKMVDCSKGLIFVLGNLDEAYTMSHDFNPDMDADEFHEQSLKINVPIIKRALKERFRNEQIARLGNMHIIYPAFNKESFKKIIALELSKISKKVYDQNEMDLVFDQSIHELIYKEGVYPTQGTRPIFTTIHQIVNTKLGKAITELILKNIDSNTVVFKAETGKVILEYLNNEKIVHDIEIEQQLNLEKLRENKKDDVQAITSVHEAGHAVVSIVLMHTIPEVVFSNTAEAGTGGFVFTKFKWKYISKKEIKSRLALYLAGFVAEKVVFGEENVTAGAESDIEKATNFITGMLKQSGMGKTVGAYHERDPSTRYFLHGKTETVDKEAENWLKSALDLAEHTLKNQELLLLHMADYLSDNRQMNKKQITELVKSYAKDFDCDSLIENGDLLFYRKHLKAKVKNLKNGVVPNIQDLTIKKESK